MMEMDSPFHQGASIEGENSKVLKRGHTITLTCRVLGIMNENTSRNGIEWMKNGESLSLKVHLSVRVCICHIMAERNSI